MDTWLWIVLVVAAIVVIGVILWSVGRTRRSRRLREGFGPEYDRTVDQTGSRREAESALVERQERREELEIRSLSPAAHDRYSSAWAATQARFVDDPAGAVSEADRLVRDVMEDRGYPTGDFEERSDLVSVDHPRLVEDYRAGHAISLASSRDEASTEDLRQAMKHYRSLFEDLLETDRVEAS